LRIKTGIQGGLGPVSGKNAENKITDNLPLPIPKNKGYIILTSEIGTNPDPSEEGEEEYIFSATLG
jgi:hypothetical protein